MKSPVAAVELAVKELDLREGEGDSILETLIKHLDFEAEIRLSGEGSETVLNVAGTSPEAAEELGSLIGRRGERLQAIQHLVNLMLSRKLGEWARVTVDIEEYRGRREAQLRALARKAGERVRETGRAVQLEPMTALERRWVHMELQGAPGIATESAGEEPERRGFEDRLHPPSTMRRGKSSTSSRAARAPSTLSPTARAGSRRGAGPCR